MAGAGDVETRGAMEVGERDGGFRCEPIQQVLRAWYGAMRLFTRGRRWERGAPYAPESYGAGICGGLAVGRRATV